MASEVFIFFICFYLISTCLEQYRDYVVLSYQSEVVTTWNHVLCVLTEHEGMAENSLRVEMHLGAIYYAGLESMKNKRVCYR